jgi:hypothetical protein
MYASPNVIMLIESKEMRWAGHLKIHTIFWFANLKGRDHSEYIGVDGMIILDWTLRKQGEHLSTGYIRLRIGTSGGLL